MKIIKKNIFIFRCKVSVMYLSLCESLYKLDKIYKNKNRSKRAHEKLSNHVFYSQ